MRGFRFFAATVVLLASSASLGCGLGGGISFGSSTGTGPSIGFEAMTRNVYYGADLAPAVGAMLAGDLDGVVGAVGSIHDQLLATDFRARARGFADELAKEGGGYGPEVVGLQEVALWRRQVPADSISDAPTPAEEVYVDQLEILLGALRERGLRYDLVAVQEGFDAELPYADGALGFVDLRITDRDVLLVRSDVAWRDAQGGRFEARLVFENGLELPTSWVACDLVTEAGPVRVISAHLEADVPELRAAQVGELLAGPAAVDGPVVVLGDLNAELLGEGGDGTIDGMLDAGFVDAWSTIHPGVPGKSFGLDADLSDPAAVATERLDYILVRAGRGASAGRAISVVGAELTGLEAGDRIVASDGRLLWLSDHGGLCAMIRVE